MDTTAHNKSEAPLGASIPGLIDEWAKNNREIVRVTVDTYKGHDVIGVRVWWPDNEGTFHPGKAGIALSTQHLPRLTAALNRALLAAQAAGLLSESGGGDA